MLAMDELRSLTQLTDEELVRLAQRGAVGPGDRGADDAFGELYARYSPPIQAFVLARVDRDEAVAQDLTAQVFTRVYRGLPNFVPGQFRAWIYAIARNSVTDHYRRTRASEPIEAALHVADPGPTPDDDAVVADARQRLHAALARLNPNQRAVVELRLHGLTGSEIAARLQMHPDAVKSAQYRAFAKLRDILGENPLGDSPRPTGGRP